MTFEEQARQLALNAQSIRANNKAACSAIDREHEKANARRSTTGIGKDRKDGVTKYAAPTIHDYAQKNPLFLKLLRETQDKYMR